jgi:hypothetical protein
MVARPSLRPVLWLLFVLAGGCASPYATDQGALAGGVGGAGLGALIGQASGHPIAGALIGAGAGTVTGAAVGAGVDNANFRNQAAAAAARQQAQAVTVSDVVTMTKSGVNEELILNHIRSHGVARPVQAGELVAMQQEGVSTRVIAAMQTAAVPMAYGPPPVVGPYYYPPPPPPYWGYPGPGYGVWVR